MTVVRVLSTMPLNVSFRRFLNQNNLVLWNDLVGRIMHIRLNNVFVWNLHQHGQFTVNSLYLAQISNVVANMNKQLWRLKVPLKIKIFMWYMRREVVLTKDNLAR
jgi:O-antigen/teichoic acid export membrane protein